MKLVYEIYYILVQFIICLGKCVYGYFSNELEL